MERVLDSAVPDHLRGGVVALGNFDGFHRGHQAVVGAALTRARAAGRPALVATFDPHPARLFRPDVAPFALTTTDQKLDLLAAFGIDGTVVMRFDAAFAALTAETFVTAWLRDAIGAAAVVSGADFTFGAKRSGDTAALRAIGAAHGIDAAVVDAVADDAGIVSSSRVRDLLRAADPRAAATLLTRPFTIRGVVEHGAKLGRTLGFPTANITLGDYLRPAYGVYAVRVRCRRRVGRRRRQSRHPPDDRAAARTPRGPSVRLGGRPLRADDRRRAGRTFSAPNGSSTASTR